MSLAWRGRFEESARDLERGRALDPVSIATLQNVAIGRYLAHDYGGVLDKAHAMVDLDETAPQGYVWQALPQLQQGQHKRALLFLEQALALDPEMTGHIGQTAYAYGLTGQLKKAVALLSTLKELSRQKYVPATDFALVHLGLAERDTALRWLERGLEEHANEMMWLKVDARFDPLRSEPRFQRLLRAMNFPN